MSHQRHCFCPDTVEVPLGGSGRTDFRAKQIILMKTSWGDWSGQPLFGWLIWRRETPSGIRSPDEPTGPVLGGPGGDIRGAFARMGCPGTNPPSLTLFALLKKR
jgi:hypothetical protein